LHCSFELRRSVSGWISKRKVGIGFLAARHVLRERGWLRQKKGSEVPAMSGLDIFAWIVLIVLVCSTTAVVIFMAMLPGMIAKKRGHPWAQAVTIAGWITLFFGFALWPLAVIWAYVDVPSPRKAETAP
jgi:hypothetical protein